MITDQHGARVYRTDLERRLEAKARRDALAADGLCINGRSHGPATHGVRCERCHRVHRGEHVDPIVKVPIAHCKRGHEFTPANTNVQIYAGQRRRACRTCTRIRDLARLTMESVDVIAAQMPEITEKDCGRKHPAPKALALSL